MLPIVVIVLAAAISLISGMCLIELLPEMTLVQVVLAGGAIFVLVCAPSLAAVFARRPPEDDEDKPE